MMISQIVCIHQELHPLHQITLLRKEVSTRPYMENILVRPILLLN